MSRWEHVDLNAGTWFIPKENSKGQRGRKRDHTVRFSDFILRQFQALHQVTGTTPWCFPASGKVDTHVDVKSVSKQVGDRQHQFKNRAQLKNRRNDNSLVLAAGHKGEWTPHDLRRTAATMLQEMRISLDVVDMCQNHVLPRSVSESSVRKSYLHGQYTEDMREAWQQLGNRLDAILSGANVIPMKTRAA